MKKSFFRRLSVAALLAASLFWTPISSATTITWTGGVGTDFWNNGDWSSAITSDLLTDTAQFNAAGFSNQPSLSVSGSVNGLAFTSATNGWVLGSTSSAYLLSVGSGGILNSSTSGPDTISANLALASTTGAESVLVISGGTLLFSGNLTLSGSEAITVGSTVNTGTLILNPSGANAVNLVTNNAGNYGLTVAGGTGATLVLGGNGSSLGPKTTSFNDIANSGGDGALNIAAGNQIIVNSGVWNVGDLGRNSTASSVYGTLQINGGTMLLGGMRYSNTCAIDIAGGSLRTTGSGNAETNGGTFHIGSLATSGSAVLNLSSGFLDLAQANSTGGGNGIGASTAANTEITLFNQSGGVFQNGVSVSASADAGTNTNFQIGGVAGTTGSNALTLTSGTMVIAGSLTATTVGSTGGVNNFNFMGGVLTASNITATNFGSSATATATANQVASSTSIGTLINYGGTLAPGGMILSTSTDSYGNITVTGAAAAGRTTITGNFTQNAAGTLSINMSGTSASALFQETTDSGKYSTVSVSGAATLGGSLTVALITGTGGSVFIPSSSNTFTILTATSSSTSVSGAFSNFNNRVIPTGISDPFSSAFTISYTGTTVTLGNYAQNEWMGSAGANNWGSGGMAVWTNGVDPNGAGVGAKFGSVGAANNAISLNANRTVGQMIFQGANYTIGAGGGTLTLDNAGATSTIMVNSNSQAINAPVVLNSNLSITGSSGAQIAFGGSISGATESVAVSGSGSSVVLSASNSYGGGTTISGGTLNYGNVNSLGTGTITMGSATLQAGVAGALANNIVLGTGASAVFDTQSHAVTLNGQITGAGSLQTISAGTLTLSNSNSYNGSTNIGNGVIDLANADAAVNSTVNVNSANGLSFSGGIGTFYVGSIAGSVNETLTDANSMAVTLNVGGNNATTTYSGILSGNGNIVKGGSGGLTLSGSNTYSGGTVINSGTFTIGGGSAGSAGVVVSGPTGTGSVTIGNGATMSNAASGDSWYMPSLATSGTITLVGGIRLNLSTDVWNLGGLTELNVNSKSVIVTSGNTLGSEATGLSTWELNTSLATPTIQNGTLSLQTSAFSSGTYAAFRIDSNVNFSANTTVDIGPNVLLFGGLGSSGSTPALIVEQGGIYDMVNSGSRYVSSLAGGGSIFSSMVTAASGTSTLNIAGTSGTTNFSGTLADAPSGAASLALSKSNGATQILSGANTYTGSTSVSSGILIVSGSLSGTTAANVTGGEMEVDGLVNNSAQVTLSGSGELSGSGSVGSITASGGVIAPGFTAADAQSSTGTLSTGGAVMLSSSTSFDIRLGLSASGTDSDMLAENGSGVVTLGGRLNLTIGSGVSMDSGLVYVIINGGSHPVSGTFAGLPNTSIISAGGYAFEILYNSDPNGDASGSGDDVVLEMTAVPEPGTLAAFICGGVLLLYRHRRRVCTRNSV